MINRLLDRLIGHRWQNQATFPPRNGAPGVVVVLCGRCGQTAAIPAKLSPVARQG